MFCHNIPIFLKNLSKISIFFKEFFSPHLDSYFSLVAFFLFKLIVKTFSQFNVKSLLGH
jgi:hypothetical protein